MQLGGQFSVGGNNEEPGNAESKRVSLIAEAEARAALVADLRGKGIEIREIVEGKRFVGRVHLVSDQFVVQQVAPGVVVIHELGKLNGKYVVGQDAHIAYENGSGHDKNQRTDAMQKGKPGTER